MLFETAWHQKQLASMGIAAVAAEGELACCSSTDTAGMDSTAALH